MTSKLFEVTDDSGFLAILDPDAYEGFVGPDWELDQLLAKLKDQMAAQRLLVWGTGQANTWRVEVRPPAAGLRGFRQVTGRLVSTRGRLLITNYESLSMAAQFPDVSLPEPHEENQIVDVGPGKYRCRITQIRDPDSVGAGPGPCDFVLEIESSNEADPPWPDIPWT